ncbi:hypothetical protein ASPWEDRAFT_120829 [Aspergillus wentii DTO 134E9]|uniref:Peptidase C15, pyroglutamyl peptidase I-like protein n=1 Tax=Aspergillus wentii DTO 134E9 TaxID=1073089 RepID=A0A1L9R676_ASPWE|nr:uncharacterized protein ASPWEDRAFT_120829 [Aspergillus wentii DTO 134E9]KAI9926918.1 hypothetical protein MW887_004017 [Aspergillus wentii]OJJ30410.1 hypothetical protein ASPWEDRAFT_120829 [Aspergillus wentii DTO 134E9]
MGDYGPGVQPPTAPLAGNPPLLSSDADEVSVLVTGFGPFKTNLVNASYLIASSLPSSFTFPAAPTSPDEPAPAPHRVSIHVHPSPIPVAYSTVRETVPGIIDDYTKAHGGRRPDIVIHMGIASTRAYYSVETKAHRDSYNISDVKGLAGYEDGEKLWRQLRLPSVLQAGRSDTSSASQSSQVVKPRANPHPPDGDFLAVWKSLVAPGTDVRISEDAGRYLCEFIFYTSLAQAYQAGQDRNVVFFHVPGACDDEAIERGKNVAIAMIKSFVACWFDGKK